VVDDAEILGMVTVGKRGRNTTEKESKRLAEAKAMNTKLKVLPVSRKET
jgi:hypothetical protein